MFCGPDLMNGAAFSVVDIVGFSISSVFSCVVNSADAQSCIDVPLLDTKLALVWLAC